MTASHRQERKAGAVYLKSRGRRRGGRMADEFEEQGWVKLGVSAALSKEYAQDQRSLLEMLAMMLENALPGEAQIERRGGLFSKKTVHRISLEMGTDRYSLEDPGKGSLRAFRTKVVRGIALKTEEIPVQEWLDALSVNLEERAKSSASARAALERFVG